jgi:hypothetical protein
VLKISAHLSTKPSLSCSLSTPTVSPRIGFPEASQTTLCLQPPVLLPPAPLLSSRWPQR